MIKLLVVATLTVLLFMAIIFGVTQCDRANKHSDNSKALEDSLHHYKNKTYTNALTAKDLAKHTAELRDYIDSKTMSATVIKEIFRTDTFYLKPDVIWGIPDTIHHSNYTEVRYFPLYHKFFENRWYSADITADTHEIGLKLKIQDSLAVRHEWKRKNLFTRRYLDVEVINHNPYTQITGLKSFQSVPKPQRFSVGVGIYGGVNLQLQPTFIIGGGIQYNLINF